MISLYAGRLQLVCDRTDRNWHARVTLGPKAEHRFDADTGTVHLPDALMRAQLIYRAAVTQLRPGDGKRMCLDCVQWDLERNRCELGIPEARRTGGRFAVRCDMYKQAACLPD